MTSASKIFFILFFILNVSYKTLAQNSFEHQFNFANELYAKGKYFDAVTELKRLLFFDVTGKFSYEANKIIGLSYKQGAKFSDAIHYFSLAELNADSEEEVYKARIEAIKINILRRTTERALALLDELRNDKRYSDKSDEINYWTGWAYIFSDKWEKASISFSAIVPGHGLALLCDSLADDLYNPTLAKTLSLIPGAGQFYTGEYISGLISIGWNVLWGYLTINAFMEDRIFDGLVIGTLLWWRFYSGNIQNAEKFAIEKNLEKTNDALQYLKNNYDGEKP